MIRKRKKAHVKICLEKNVESARRYWDEVRLIHQALPEINKDEIDLATTFLDKKLEAPILIAAMTGGFKEAKKINENLATAAEKLNLGFGVGSQRAMLQCEDLAETYTCIKKHTLPLVLANVGATQLVPQKGTPSLKLSQIEELIESINADVLAIHLNFLQEAVARGDTNARGCLARINKIKEALDVPIILKETGAGISLQVAQKIKRLGVGVDVGGLGGTSFALVEYYRAKNKLGRRLGKTFCDWGIPTPISILRCRKAGVEPIIGTGGIRRGLDGAKAIALGSDLFGVALPLLKPAIKGANNVFEELKIFIEELKTAMFLTGAKGIEELRKTPVILEPTLLYE